MSQNYLPPGPPGPYVTPPSTQNDNLRNLTLVIHALYVAGAFTGIAGVAGVVIAYLKRREAEGTIYASHFTYAIRTFWIGLALGLVGWLLTFILVGFIVLAFGWVWFVIRIVRALLAWNDRQPIDDPARFF